MKVLVFGTFDYVHKGHIYFLKKAKSLGSELIAVIARDATVEKIKGALPSKGELVRKKEIENLNIADVVMLGNKKPDKYKIIKKIKPDVVALGYDQHAFTEELDKVFKESGLNTKIIRLKSYYPREYKSSIIKKLKNIS